MQACAFRFFFSQFLSGGFMRAIASLCRRCANTNRETEGQPIGISSLSENTQLAAPALCSLKRPRWKIVAAKLMNVPGYIPTVTLPRTGELLISFAARAQFRPFNWGMQAGVRPVMRRGTISSHLMKAMRRVA
jgi:hypothetical protein